MTTPWLASSVALAKETIGLDAKGFGLDDETLYSSLITFAASFCVWGAFTIVLIGARPRWTSLERSHVVAMVHGLYSFYLALRIFNHHFTTLKDAPPGEATQNLWFTYDDFHAVAVAMTAGYLLWDLLYGSVEGFLDKQMVFHHIVGLTAAVFGCVMKWGLPLQALYLLNEGSTLFTNAHGLFKWKDWRRTVNGFFMLLSFLVCRIMVGLMLLRVAVVMFFGEGSRLRGLYPDMYFFILQVCMGFSLQFLNLYWFSIMCAGFRKSLGQMLGWETKGQEKNNKSEEGVATGGAPAVQKKEEQKTQEDPTAVEEGKQLLKAAEEKKPNVVAVAAKQEQATEKVTEEGAGVTAAQQLQQKGTQKVEETPEDALNGDGGGDGDDDGADENGPPKLPRNPRRRAMRAE
jgi:hypothetical protein